jgi:predicted ATPase/class 3 adenylate cyclase
VAGRELPTGTLTFLFTDLEGSTRLLHEFPDSYASLLETHRGIIRDAVTKCGGIEFGTGGDALFIVFDSAPSAVRCAILAQRALQSHPWPVPSLKVRMALHTGEARVVDDDYVGLALHVVARLCSAAHGEQVVLSPATRALAGDADLVDLGSHQLRDVAEPVQVFQVCADGLSRDFPALRTLDARPNNLPVSVDRLIGRDLETVEVAAALHEHRLVTLMGSGGSGKTRLALEVGASLVSEFRDGVWLVQLGAATTPDQVVGFLAQELHVGERVAETLSTTVVEYLATREVLLVLDNCEHLVDAVAALVHDVMTRCALVKVLATSRELIGVHGEQAIAVAPLSVGSPEQPGDAMRLFIERASEINPRFVVNGSDLGALAEICRRLDGLPLAIELAAARTRTISVAQLAERLHDRFHLLTGGSRAAMGRQRTLEAVVAWSYDLLTPSEQQLFRSLSVFPDSFPLEAAEAVATVHDGDVLQTLGHLVDKSLVLAQPSSAYRYGMLETIRQYGRDRLVETNESEDAHARLTAWIMTLTGALERDMRTARQDSAIRAVIPERSNARAALQWALDNHDLTTAVRIASAIPLMITSRRRVLLQELLTQIPDLPDARRAQVLLTLGNLAMEQGHWDDCARFARDAAEVFAALGDAGHHAWARYFEVFAIWADPAAHERARQLAEEMVVTFREMREDFGLAYALWVESQFSPGLERARSAARESEALFRELDAQFGLAHALEGRALVRLKFDTDERVDLLLDEALAIFADAQNLGCTAHCLEAIAAVLAIDNRIDDAALLVGAAEHLREETGQQHRAWEREGHARTQLAFEVSGRTDDIERQTAIGRTFTLADAVRVAQSFLATETQAPAPSSSRPMRMSEHDADQR